MTTKKTTKKPTKKPAKKVMVPKVGKKPTGRPSKRTDKMVDEIVARLSKGEPLAAICRDEKMPDRTTVWDRAQGDEQLSQRLARAREDGEEMLAAECLEIADDGRNDWMVRQAANGDEQAMQLNSEHVQRSKLRIDTRLKLLAVFNPAKYGERRTLNHQGRLSLEQLVVGEGGEA